MEWVLFDGGTNTLSSELRNNKEQQQQQQITSAKDSSDDDNDNDNEITVDHEYPEKQRQRCTTTAFLATEVNTRTSRLCACQVGRTRVSYLVMKSAAFL